jgi:ABC-type lipoprotein release transport system permease subunit
LAFFFDRLGEAFRMALLAMNAHRMRTFLTMLGIIIGIASVVSVVALGNGSQKQILENISSLGTNTITVYQGVVLVITRVLHKSKHWCLLMQKHWQNSLTSMESVHLPIPV